MMVYEKMWTIILQLQLRRTNYGDDMNAQMEILKVLVKYGEFTVSITSSLNGGYFCYFAYVLLISKYSVFLWVVLTNTGIFLRG